MAATRLNSVSEPDVNGSCAICNTGFGSQDYVTHCEYCLLSFHHGCSGFSDTNFKAFNKLHAAGLVLFHCETCKDEIKKLKDKVSQLESQAPAPPSDSSDRLLIVEQKIDKLAQALKSAVGEDIGETEITAGGTQLSPITYASIASKGVTSKARVITVDYFNKAREEEAHRRSLVVVGLPENGADFEDVSRMAKMLDCSAAFTEVFRMGRLPKPDDPVVRPRLLKVHVASSSVVKSLLSQSSRLRNSEDFKGVYIRRSMTKEEREALGKTRAQCRELNESENSHGVKYVVFNERIVRFKDCELQEGRLVGGVRDKGWTLPPQPSLNGQGE